MSTSIEMYCVAPVGPDATEPQPETVRGKDRLVAEVSLDSAALPHLLPWLALTSLAALFDDLPGQKHGIYFGPGQLDVLKAGIPTDGPDGAEGVFVAVEDALEEARWLKQGLWIGLA